MLDATRRGQNEFSDITGPLLRLRVSLSRNPWRIGSAWAVVAGALSGRVPLLGGEVLLRLAGAVILADVAWGTIGHLAAAGSREREEAATPALPSVPYAQPFAPAAQALRFLSDLAFHDGIAGGTSEAGWHELTVALALTAGLGAMLGTWALALSAAVILVALLAWGLAQRGVRPSFLSALLSTFFPWVLGLSLARPFTALPAVGVAGPLLGLAFTVQQWGVQRARVSPGSRLWGIEAGEIAVLAALVLLGQPWAAAAVAVLYLPTAWWTARAQGTAVDLDVVLARCAPWWLAGLLVAAVAFA